MANHFSDIMDQVLELPQSDRAILVNHLWQSLDQDHRLPLDEMDTVLTAYHRHKGEIEEPYTFIDVERVADFLEDIAKLRRSS